MNDDLESSNSPATVTPSISNPGTPRSDAGLEMRNTPPPVAQTKPQVFAAGGTVAQLQQQQAQFLLAQQQHLQQLQSQSKYSQLLAVIEDMGRDIRPTYSGSRTSAERLKRGIVHGLTGMAAGGYNAVVDDWRSSFDVEVEMFPQTVRNDSDITAVMDGAVTEPGTSMAWTQQVIDTEYSADSVEWCRLAGYQHLLLCGTYQLAEGDSDSTESSGTPQKRLGRLYVYSLTYTDDTQTLSECSRHDMPGILDIKWSSTEVNGRPCFGLVNSIGQLRVYSVYGNNEITLTTEESLGDDCLGLSLEWNNTINASGEPWITASDSKGRVSVYRLSGGKLQQTATWKAHNFEAWITAFNQWNVDILYSGGDDCTLKAWDLRLATGSPVLTSRRHTMGVCSIQSSPIHEHVIATGSYDEQLLIWDSRQMKRPLTETSLGGGIWRIKWEPDTGRHILTATMYNGFHVVDTSSFNVDPPPVVCHYREHQSLAYGADWCGVTTRDGAGGPGGTQAGRTEGPYSTIATCSFYEHSLRLWNFKTTIKDN